MNLTKKIALYFVLRQRIDQTDHRQRHERARDEEQHRASPREERLEVDDRRSAATRASSRSRSDGNTSLGSIRSRNARRRRDLEEVDELRGRRRLRNPRRRHVRVVRTRVRLGPDGIGPDGICGMPVPSDIATVRIGGGGSGVPAAGAGGGGEVGAAGAFAFRRRRCGFPMRGAVRRGRLRWSAGRCAAVGGGSVARRIGHTRERRWHACQLRRAYPGGSSPSDDIGAHRSEVRARHAPAFDFSPRALERAPCRPSRPRGRRRRSDEGPAKDDPAPRGDRSKRLLDLVMILLGARTPVTYRDIREQFSAYQTLNVEAGLRAFERDKADLLELGVPIRYITPDEDDSLEDGGYVIDLKRFKMPEVRLTPDEISALVLAASVAHAMPGGTYPKIVDLALKKLAFDLPDLPDTPTEFPRPAPVLVHFPGRTLPAARPRRRARAVRDLRDARVRDAPAQARDAHLSGRGDRHGQQARSRSVRARLSRGRVARRRLVSPPQGGPLVPRRSHARRRAGAQAEVSRLRAPRRLRRQGLRAALAVDVHDRSARGGPARAVARGRRGRQRGLRLDRASSARTATALLVTFDCGNFEFAATRILAAKGAIRIVRGERLRARIAEELAAIARTIRAAPVIPGRWRDA